MSMTMTDMNGAVTEEAAAEPAPPMTAASRPSTWSSLWAALALFWLVFARAWFRRLG